MSSLALKIFASVAMLGDHVGYFLQTYGNQTFGLILRAVGRTAFPIYCFMISFGYRKTHNKYLYLTRIIIAGLISEIPFNYCFFGTFSLPSFRNVFFTLALGLIGIILYDFILELNNKLMRYLAFIPSVLLALLAEKLGTDYGGFGVLLIFLFYISDNAYFSSAALFLFSSHYLIECGIDVLFGIDISSKAPVMYWYYMELFAFLAIIPILLFNGKKGYSPKSAVGKSILKYSFYLFYPLHIIILAIIFR